MSSHLEQSDAYLAVPNGGTMRAATVERLFEVLHDHPKVTFDCKVRSSLSVAQSRNAIVKRFLEARPARAVLVMVDSDIIPPPHFLRALTSALAAPVAMGTAPFGAVVIPHVMAIADGSGLGYSIFRRVTHPEGMGRRAYQMIEPVGGLHPVDGAATGCIAITREALERVSSGTGVAFTIPDDPDAAITTEDFLFCEDLQACGLQVGYFWDGWFCDHHQTAPMGRLIAGSAAIVPTAPLAPLNPLEEVSA